MKKVPPTMQFEDQYADEIEREERRPSVPRYEYEWEKVAASLPPDMPHTFTCCGTLYRFAFKEDRVRGEIKHNEVRHG